MSLLSDRQREDLCVSKAFFAINHVDLSLTIRHKSMLDYLHTNNFIDAYSALKAATSTEYSPDPKGRYAGLLEKKWTSVIRLQKKVG